MSDNIQHYTGDRLTEAESVPEPLIQGYLYPGDLIMILGSEKAGKSILALQMAANLSSGTPFLGKYKTKKSCVAYLQTEGKKDETAFRIQNMMKTIPFDKDNFHRLYKRFLPLDVPEYLNKLDNMLASLNPKPEVLFDDSLYTTMTGDLNSNEDVRKFLFAYSMILEKYNLTSPMIHHAKRDEFFEGKKTQLGDKVSYGSVFLRANVDHIIFLDMQKDKTRTLSCDTQRSGNVAEMERLVLIQPKPLQFKLQGSYTASEETILSNFVVTCSRSTISKNTGLSDSSIDNAIRKFLIDERIKEIGTTEGLHPEKTYVSV